MSKQLIFGEGEDCPCVAIHVRPDGELTMWEWPNRLECEAGMKDYGLEPGEYHVRCVDIPLFAINCP